MLAWGSFSSAVRGSAKGETVERNRKLSIGGGWKLIPALSWLDVEVKF